MARTAFRNSKVLNHPECTKYLFQGLLHESQFKALHHLARLVNVLVPHDQQTDLLIQRRALCLQQIVQCDDLGSVAVGRPDA